LRLPGLAALLGTGCNPGSTAVLDPGLLPVAGL
jgi:hypothetical protein